MENYGIKYVAIFTDFIVIQYNIKNLIFVRGMAALPHFTVPLYCIWCERKPELFLSIYLSTSKNQHNTKQEINQRTRHHWGNSIRLYVFVASKRTNTYHRNSNDSSYRCTILTLTLPE